MNPYYSQNNFSLYLGDCIEIMNELPEGSVDMIFADPPYNLSNDGITCHSGRMSSVNKGDWDKSNGPKEDFIFHYNWIEACKRVLKPTGTIWISGTYHSIYACGYALQVQGYQILNDIAWFKPNAAPNISCRCFTASHESLIWAKTSKKAQHTFNYDVMKHSNWHKDDLIKKEGKQMRSVWAIGTPKKKEKEFGKHPTQKPEALLKRLVLASTHEGDVILDPFTGSSTTGVVAKKYNRKYIGIDKEKDYIELSIQRFEAIKPDTLI